MNNKWFLLLAALLAFLLLTIACSSGGDDDDSAADDDSGQDDDADDDNADDDASDDDDDDDDDTSDELTVENTTQSEYLDGADGKALWNPLVDPTDVVQVAWDNGVLKIEDLFAYVNCGFELEVEAEIGGNNEIRITEIGNGTVADCICPFDFNYEIDGLEPGDYTIVLKRQEVGTTAQYEVFSLPFSFGDENKKWYVPYVEIFQAGAIQQPFEVRYAACYMYHAEDQMFMVRGYGSLWHVFSYDWFDIDNPGEPNPNCQMPVNVEIGEMPAGDYTFGAPSFHEDAWEMLTFDVTL